MDAETQRAKAEALRELHKGPEILILRSSPRNTLIAWTPWIPTCGYASTLPARFRRWTTSRRCARCASSVRPAETRLCQVDVLVAPTVPITPPTVDEVATDEAYGRTQAAMTRNTIPANLLGLCGLTMPVALDGAGMPVGLQFMAPGGHEERVLAAALACERVLGSGRERLGPPPLCAR